MNLLFETKYALRLLKKSPAYTTTCVLVTAVGIAVSLVAFTLIYTLGFKPLEYADSENWYVIMFSGEGGIISNTDEYFFQRLQQQDFQYFSLIGRQYTGSSVISDGDISLRVSTGYKSPNVLLQSSVQPLMGRLFQEADAATGSAPTVILSYQAWHVYYQGRPDIVGQQTRIDGKAHTVVGVLPDGFNLGFAHDIHLPHTQVLLDEPPPYGSGSPIVELRSENDLLAATAEINRVFQQVKEEMPDAYPRYTGIVVHRVNTLAPNIDTINLMMVIVAGVFVLLACLNTGSLLFTNTLKRQHELSIRNSMGSSLWDLLKHSLLESLFICLLGTLLGLILTQITILKIDQITGSLFSSGGVNGEHHFVFQIGLPTVVCAIAVLVLMWLLSAVLPVFRAVRSLPKAGMANINKGANDVGQSRLSASLAGVQVVFSCCLLILSAILVYAISYASQRDLGISTDQLLTANLLLSEQYADDDGKRLYLDQLSSELQTINSVESVGYASSLPSLQYNPTKYQLEDRTFDINSLLADPVAQVNASYFDTAGIDILQGRNFNSNDNQQSLSVVIVDEHFASRYWPDGDAVGKRIQINAHKEGSEWATIIGVTSHVLGNIRYQADTAALIYQPLSQIIPNQLRLLVKHKGTFSDLLPHVNRAATAVNRNFPLSYTTTLDDYYLTQNAMSFSVMLSRMFMYVAVVTGLLAIIGIFAVFTRNIIRRTREFGVRRALGASRENILWLHLKKGLIFSGVGCGAGTFLALLIMGALFSDNGILGEVSVPLVPIITTILAGLVTCILLASFLPARKATVREPGDALRVE